jgi:hypothetical protein
MADFSRNCKMTTNVIKTAQCQISWKSVQRFSNCFLRTDRQEDGLDLIDAPEAYERAWNESGRKISKRKRFFCRVVPAKQSLKLRLTSFNYVRFKIGFRCWSRVFEICQNCVVVKWFLFLNLNFDFTGRKFNQENLLIVLSSYRAYTN